LKPFWLRAPPSLSLDPKARADSRAGWSALEIAGQEHLVCARQLDDVVTRRVSDGHHAGVRCAEAMGIT
jgi:hypothetical protein